MIYHTALARSYARALLGILNNDKQKMQLLLSSLQVLSKVYEDVKVQKILRLLPTEVARSLLIEFTELELSHDSANTLSPYAAKLMDILERKFFLIPEIYKILSTHQAKASNTMEIVLRSTKKLLKSQKDKLEQVLINRVGLNVKFIKEQVDRKLLGGVVLASGDLTLDGSILCNLKRLRRKLLQAQI